MITDEVFILTKELNKRDQEKQQPTIEDLQNKIKTMKSKAEEQQQDINDLEKKLESTAKELRRKSRDYVDIKQKNIKLEEDILINEQERRKLTMEIEKKDLFLKTLHQDADIPFGEDSITQLRQHYGKTKHIIVHTPAQQHQPIPITTAALDSTSNPIKYTWTSHSKAFQKELQRRGITTFKFGGTKDNQKNAEHFLNIWDQLLTLFPFDDSNKISAFRATMDVGDTTTRGLMAALENKQWEEYYKILKQTAGLTNDSPSQNMFLLIDLQQTAEMSVTEYYGRFFDLLQRSIPMPAELQVKWFIRGLLKPLQEQLERWIQEQPTPPTLTQTKDKAQSEYHIKLQANLITPNIVASIKSSKFKRSNVWPLLPNQTTDNQIDDSSSDSNDDSTCNTNFAVTLNDLNAVQTAHHRQSSTNLHNRYHESHDLARTTKNEEQPRRIQRQDYSRTTRSPSPIRNRRSVSPGTKYKVTNDRNHHRRTSPTRTRHKSRSPSPNSRRKEHQDKYLKPQDNIGVPPWAIPEPIWKEARKSGSLFGVRLPDWEKTATTRTDNNAQIDLKEIDEAYRKGYRQLLPRRRLTTTRKEDFFVGDEENAYCLIHDTYGDHSTYRCPFNCLRDNPNFLYFPDREDLKIGGARRTTTTQIHTSTSSQSHLL